MKIALGSDHAGFHYKEAVHAHLIAKGHEVIDYGCAAAERCDYPDYCRPAAQAVADGTADRCIVFGGSGNGESITANRIPGVRCALCWNEQTALWSRGHNDANGLAIGERTISIDEALTIVTIWLDTPFDGGRHQARIDKIDA